MTDLDQTVRPSLDLSSNLPLDIPFTAAIARAEGVPRHRLTQWVHTGLLHQPLKGVYASSAIPDSTTLRVACLLLVVPDDCVVCDRHAGWLHRAEMVLAPNEHIHARPISFFRPSGNGRLQNPLALSGERNLRDEDVTEVMGIPVTTMVRTAWDLGRVRRREDSLSGMDQMLRLAGFPQDEFLAGIERFRGMRWVTNLRTLAPLADPRAESPPESVLRLYWMDSGLPQPEPQLEVWDSGVLIARLDIGNQELGYAAEYDGTEWHTSVEQRRHDRFRRRAVADRGFVIDAFTKANVFGQRRDAEQLLLRGAARAKAMTPHRAYQ